ncbi:MAG: ribosome silencing factor [Candidatus Dormibacteraceae bacterium]
MAPPVPTSNELARLLIAAAEEKQAWDPILIDVSERTTLADYFVICEGETDRQVRAIADAMVARARDKGVRPLTVGGQEDATWVLLDFDSVLAHVFLPGERAYYDLESLWAAVNGRRSKQSSN